MINDYVLDTPQCQFSTGLKQALFSGAIYNQSHIDFFIQVFEEN